MDTCKIGFNSDYPENAPTLEQLSEMQDYAILEFGAPWCGHCKAAAAVVQQVMDDLGVAHIKVYDGKGKRLGRSFKVKLWPTLILLKAGEEVARVVRPLSEDELHSFIEYMNSNS